MAALSLSNTGRLFVDYNDGLNDHTLMLRWVDDFSSVNTAMSVAAAVFSNLATMLYTVTILGARFADEGTNVTNPITWTGDATYGTGTMPGANSPRQVMFEGRDSTGRRWKLSVFGCNFATPNDFRLAQEDETEIGDVLADLAIAFSTGQISSINKRTVDLKQYASVNFNNHFEVVARG
jgi:hypothetical protein